MMNSIFSKIEFSSLELDSRLVKVLESSEKEGGFGLNRATNVQSAVVPILSKRCNMLIRSQTGSGKTFSFLLPMVNNLMNVKPQLQRSSGTRALIVSPTRELCHQIEEVLLKLTTKACCYCVPGAISGGEKKKSEKARLRKGIVILVSTPGRLLDHLNTTESFNLNNLNWIVLDEADRLLDMGFEQSVLEILSIIRGVRLPGLKEETIQRRMKEPSSGQLLDLNYTFKQKTAQRAKISSYSITHVMASATLSKNILKLAAPVLGINRFAIVDADRKTVDEFNSPEEMLNSDIFTGDTGGRNGVVSFDSDDEDDNVKSKKSRGLEDGENIGKSVETLSQYYMMVTCKWRLAALCSFLKQHRNKKVVVFFSTCDSVDFHSMLFRQASWPNQLDAEIPGAGGQQQMQDNEGEMEVTTAGSRTTSATRQQLRFQMGIAAETEFIEPLGSSSIPLFADESSRLYRLHGNVVQKDRQAIYKEFSNAKRGVLFCTDVAARGLDMPNVDWILQYDPPCDTTDYVHRVGRTARRGLSGQSLIFLLPSEASYIQLLSSHSLVPEPLSLQSLLMDASAHIPGSNKFKNIEEMTAVILQRRMERITLSNKFLTGAARQAFRSYVRAYATHGSDTKSIFRVQLLHLGHVAKSFALRENPAALRNQEDIIAKISNGEYSQEKMTMVLDKVEKKAIRDKKYGLAAKNGKKNGSDGAKKSSSKSSSLSNHTNKRTSFVEAKPNVSTSLSSSLPAHLQNLSSTSNKGYSEKQALRKMSKKATPTVSGKFRNAGGSYFKKRLKSQMISEFSA